MLRFAWGIFVPLVLRGALARRCRPGHRRFNFFPLPSLAHTALARRYRPRRFGEVATQEHVSETLRRAVASDRVGHAYLFCGPRGVGKTTLARVLAMALNCPHRSGRASTDEDPGEPGEPCGECESCRRIWSGNTALDVVEIDAASNRGVDDARDLRSRAMYAPSEEGRYKVYIVDEAHMLTREAWNALLKVLEEPPDRVIFIFATTEPEKIEQTAAPILSRCQRFDFRRVGVPEIIERLREVLAREGVNAPDEALRVVARKADGGMRDALSLTDQVLSLSGGEGVTLEMVRRILGVVEEERFLQTFDLLHARDRAGLFELVEELLDQGYDLVEFYYGLVESLRTLLRLGVGGEMAELPPERREEWAARASRVAPSDVVRMLGMASRLETGGSLRRSSQPRILLELLLLQFSYLDRTVELETLLETLGGEGDPGSGPPEGATGLASGEEGKRGFGSGPERNAPSLPSGTGRAGSSDATTPSVDPDTGNGSPTLDANPASTIPTPTEGDPDVTESPTPPRLEGRNLQDRWHAFLREGEGIPSGLTLFLLGSEAVAVEEGVLELHVPPGPALERLGQKEITTLERRMGAFSGTKVRIRVVAAETAVEKKETRVSEGEVRAGRLGDLLAKEPGLKEAVEGWDLEIIE